MVCVEYFRAFIIWTTSCEAILGPVSTFAAHFRVEFQKLEQLRGQAVPLNMASRDFGRG